MTFGNTYKFIVQAENAFGLSVATAELVLLSATVPLAPDSVATSVLADQLVVTWAEPSAQGSPITGYRVYIRQNDLLYEQDLVACDHSSSTTLTCSIPLATLIIAPFSLSKDQSVFAKVRAINFYGDGDYSSAGNGAVIVLLPDAPNYFQNDPSLTNENQIAMTWEDGLSDGGTPIIDYRITYDQSIGTYITLATGITELKYTTLSSLTSGRTYKFKIEARNSVGYSLPSSEISILAA